MAKKLISTNPCPVTSTLDLGTVQPGERVGDIAGFCNWGAGQVTASLTNDNSGGLFTGFTLGVYDVDCSPGGGGGVVGTVVSFPLHHNARWSRSQSATAPSR
jgi:hypothetical protein